jgi:hypothetical protein
MSSDPPKDDEQAEVDDGTLSEVVRKPTRSAGDLSEVADASPGITTDDLARDLEAVASKQGAPREGMLLADLLERVKRIEEYLGIGPPRAFERPRPNPTELRPVSSAWPEGSQRETNTTGSAQERLDRLLQARGSREGEVDQSEKSSTPED